MKMDAVCDFCSVISWKKEKENWVKYQLQTFFKFVLGKESKIVGIYMFPQSYC